MDFDRYRDAYRHIDLDRTEDGVLTMRMHTDGGPLIWGQSPHEELGPCFRNIGSDRSNKVVILTGTGDRFSAATDAARRLPRITAGVWDPMYWHSKQLLMNLLEIEVPMVAVVNGPALIHPELALLCDIVLAADDATFTDGAHLPHGVVPGDGTHIIWPILLGLNRARYFLFTDQTLTAREALDLGLINEIHARENLPDRAREHAAHLLTIPELTRRYTRILMTQPVRKAFLDQLGYGLALEGLAFCDMPES